MVKTKTIYDVPEGAIVYTEEELADMDRQEEEIAERIKSLEAENARLRNGLKRISNMHELSAYASAGDPTRREAMNAHAMIAGEVDRLLAEIVAPEKKP